MLDKRKLSKLFAFALKIQVSRLSSKPFKVLSIIMHNADDILMIFKYDFEYEKSFYTTPHPFPAN